MIELLSVVLGMLIGAEERVNKLELARLAESEFSRGSSNVHAVEQDKMSIRFCIHLRC